MISRNDAKPPEVSDWPTDPQQLNDIIHRGFTRAVQRAIAHHHLDGRSVPLWQDGRIVELHPDGTVTPLRRDRT